MRLEIRCYVIVGSACVAILIAAYHQHPECETGKEWCELHWVHLNEGQEKEPTPLMQQASTSSWATSSSLNLNFGDTGVL
jgi:hypothetical protein